MNEVINLVETETCSGLEILVLKMSAAFSPKISVVGEELESFGD